MKKWILLLSLSVSLIIVGCSTETKDTDDTNKSAIIDLENESSDNDMEKDWPEENKKGEYSLGFEYRDGYQEGIAYNLHLGEELPKLNRLKFIIKDNDDIWDMELFIPAFAHEYDDMYIQFKYDSLNNEIIDLEQYVDSKIVNYYDIDEQAIKNILFNVSNINRQTS